MNQRETISTVKGILTPINIEGRKFTKQPQQQNHKFTTRVIKYTQGQPIRNRLDKHQPLILNVGAIETIQILPR